MISSRGSGGSFNQNYGMVRPAGARGLVDFQAPGSKIPLGPKHAIGMIAGLAAPLAIAAAPATIGGAAGLGSGIVSAVSRGIGRTPIKPTDPVGRFAGDALSRGGPRTPNNTQTRSAPKPPPLTPAQRGARTRASNRADAAKAAAKRQQAADKKQANLERAAKVGIGVAGGLVAAAAGATIRQVTKGSNTTSSSSGAYHRGSGGYAPRPAPYDPNLNPAPPVSSSSSTTKMDNPSKLAFYLAWAKAENLTGKDASNFAYTRLKEYKRGGRIRGGL